MMSALPFALATCRALSPFRSNWLMGAPCLAASSCTETGLVKFIIYWYTIEMVFLYGFENNYRGIDRQGTNFFPYKFCAIFSAMPVNV